MEGIDNFDCFRLHWTFFEGFGPIINYTKNIIKDEYSKFYLISNNLVKNEQNQTSLNSLESLINFGHLDVT